MSDPIRDQPEEPRNLIHHGHWIDHQLVPACEIVGNDLTLSTSLRLVDCLDCLAILLWP